MRTTLKYIKVHHIWITFNMVFQFGMYSILVCKSVMKSSFIFWLMPLLRGIISFDSLQKKYRCNEKYNHRWLIFRICFKTKNFNMHYRNFTFIKNIRNFIIILQSIIWIKHDSFEATCKFLSLIENVNRTEKILMSDIQPFTKRKSWKSFNLSNHYIS